MSALYPTPHIHATPDDLAKTVLMPGDPLRAEFVAKNYLKDAVLFNNVRGIQGYTGTWKGKRVSVMASGMCGCLVICEPETKFCSVFNLSCFSPVNECKASTQNLKVVHTTSEK